MFHLLRFSDVIFLQPLNMASIVVTLPVSQFQGEYSPKLAAQDSHPSNMWDMSFTLWVLRFVTGMEVRALQL